MRMRVFVLLIFVSIILVGCQTQSVKPEDPTLNERNSSALHIYRVAGQFVGAGIEHRVFVSGDYIGALRDGGSVSRRVLSGTVTASISGYAFGMPTGIRKEIVLQVSPGNEYFIRISNQVSGFYSAGPNPVVVTSSGMELVSKEQWQARQ